MYLVNEQLYLPEIVLNKPLILFFNIRIIVNFYAKEFYRCGFFDKLVASLVVEISEPLEVNKMMFFSLYPQSGNH